MELSVMRTRLRKRIGNPTLTDVPDSDLNQHINTAYLELVNKFRFHLGRRICIFDTVIGQPRYGLPTDLAVLFRIRDNTNERKMIKLDDPRRARLTNHTKDQLTSAGTPANITLDQPRYYMRHRDWVELHPVPDGVYEMEIFYKIVVEELVADTDEPVIPETWHVGIVSLARYWYYDEEGDLPKAKNAMNAFEVWLSRQPVEVDEEKIDFDSGVGVPTLSELPVARLDFHHSP